MTSRKTTNGVFAIKTIKVFISHSSQDKEIAGNICAFLERHGKECWIAPRNIAAGAEYGEEIINGIEESDVMVLVFSKASNDSQHVLREVERAVNRKMPVIAFKTEDCVLSKSMEYFLLANQWLDATSDPNAALLPLNDSVDLTDKLKNKTPGVVTAPGNTVRVTNKAIPIMLGVLAVTVIVAAIVIASVYGSRDDDESVPDETQATQTSAIAEAPAQTTAATETDESETTTTSEPKTLPKFSTGEFIRFGNYRPSGYSVEYDDSSIKWQILDVDESNKTLRLISAQILDLKPFDCAESGTYNVDMNGNAYDRNKWDTYSDDELMQFRGSNNWLTSDLRAWLNAMGKPQYLSLFQLDGATDENGNGFEDSQGFLAGFTPDELEMLAENALDDGQSDLVTLLTTDEVDKYMKSDSFILHPTVTKSAIASDETTWYKTFEDSGSRDYFWLTRTPSDLKICEITVVQSEIGHELYSTYTAAASGLGVRPVITVKYGDADASLFKGEGTNASPYSFGTSE